MRVHNEVYWTTLREKTCFVARWFAAQICLPCHRLHSPSSAAASAASCASTAFASSSRLHCPPHWAQARHPNLLVFIVVLLFDDSFGDSNIFFVATTHSAKLCTLVTQGTVILQFYCQLDRLLAEIANTSVSCRFSIFITIQFDLVRNMQKKHTLGVPSKFCWIIPYRLKTSSNNSSVVSSGRFCT